MSAQGAAAAGDAAENTTTTTEAGSGEHGQPAPATEVFGTPVGAILAEMEDLPEDVRTAEATAAKKEAEPSPQSSPEGRGGEEDRPTPAPKPNAGKLGTPRPKQQPATGADEDHPIPEEWPQSARQRVAEEAAKRRERTEALKRAEGERDQARREAEALRKRQPVTVSPSARDPLADIADVPSLLKARNGYKELLQWSTLNSDGLEGVQIGVDPQTKEPVLRDYSKEEMARIRLESQEILQEAIPAKANYLQTRAAIEPMAREEYPTLFEEGTEDNNEFNLILQQCPELMRFPDFQMWIGDAIYRRNERLKAAEEAAKNNGKEPSPTVAAIRAKQPAKVPTVPGVRTLTPKAERPGGRAAAGDEVVRQREQKAIESGGDDQDVEDLVSAILDGKERKDAALV